jgi:hypothetical protein
MATQEPGRAPAAPPALAALPRVEDVRAREGVREAFDTFRRHVAQLQAQLRVAQAARGTTHPEPLGHAVRMDARAEAKELVGSAERDSAQALRDAESRADHAEASPEASVPVPPVTEPDREEAPAPPELTPPRRRPSPSPRRSRPLRSPRRAPARVSGRHNR